MATPPIKLYQRRADILATLRDEPGRTAKQLQKAAGFPTVNQTSRELNVLAELGFVRPCGVQENGKRGRKPFVWRLA